MVGPDTRGMPVEQIRCQMLELGTCEGRIDVLGNHQGLQ